MPFRKLGPVMLALVMLLFTLAARGASQTTAKAIWEPVNYTEDINLGSVFFVTPLIGWAAGEHGTIIRTGTGGTKWVAQLGGDPQSPDAAIDGLRFIDATHGWATERFPQTDTKLFRTFDGMHWEVAGAIPHVFQHTYSDYAFTTTTFGAALVGPKIFYTRNGGKDWQDVFTCEGKVEVEGLAQQVECNMLSVSFVSRDIGFALGGAYQAQDKAFVAKTIDGGASWKVQVVDNVNIYDSFRGSLASIAFRDELHGVICDYHGRLYLTNDGAVTWHAVAGKGGSNHITFADPEVAFSMDGKRLAYSANGGDSWFSRNVAFPADPIAFSAPRRDRAYVVGAHGMIYTYHVVQGSAPSHLRTVPASIFAPPPVAFETSLSHLALETASAAPAFTQDVTASPAAQAAAIKRMTTLQLAFDAATALLPDFLARYRNLNLVVLGLRTAGSLPDQAANVKNAFAAFKQSGNPQAAQAALAQISAGLGAFKQLADTALQTTPTAETP